MGQLTTVRARCYDCGGVEGLADYLFDCWSLYNSLAGRPSVVGHCPVAYFGDLHAYASSSPRVITVGLNPSRLEFDDRFPMRFPSDLGSADVTGDQMWLSGTYASGLNSYFFLPDRQPYSTWFDNSFKQVLAGIGASFYPADKPGAATAIHTDLYSPIATSPVWSGLYRKDRELACQLTEKGPPMWLRLMNILQPDIIVASVSRGATASLGLPLLPPPLPIQEIEAKRGSTQPQTQVFQLLSCKRGILLTGGAGRKPTHAIARHQREQVGEIVRTRWNQLTS